MNRALVDQVVHAVLYEGYILYPYRASAKKNRQRFTFGRVYPEAYNRAQHGAEPCLMQTQCLIEGPEALLELTVRFLHPMARDIGALAAPLKKLPEPDNPDFFHEVTELEIDGELYQAWQEVVEREIHVHPQPVAALKEKREVPFFFPASRRLEPIFDRRRNIAGVIVRRQASVSGYVEISAEPVATAPGVTPAFRITTRIVNRTPVPLEELPDPDAVLMRTFASTHTILAAHNGAFVSSLDPPEPYAQAVSACKNVGTWPILVGDEARKERDVMISSPIILYDFPKIAPESPGDLFDSAEIDEILTLRIMAMTDEEKKEMRRIDAQARRILERTEALPPERLLKMHGTMREVSPFDEDFFNPSTRLQSVCVDGISLRKGDRVRVRPRSRADVMDLAVAGKIAVIEAIEQDAENKAHLALVMEDDPGKDLGFMRQPGHRFFYGADEVEPIREAP